MRRFLEHSWFKRAKTKAVEPLGDASGVPHEKRGVSPRVITLSLEPAAMVISYCRLRFLLDRPTAPLMDGVMDAVLGRGAYSD